MTSIYAYHDNLTTIMIHLFRFVKTPIHLFVYVINVRIIILSADMVTEQQVHRWKHRTYLESLWRKTYTYCNKWKTLPVMMALIWGHQFR